ncbi:potassium-transporting P-type ATPase D chain [Paenibacillus baekrokdamisoli]|uniref:Potassium-transporting P-type ATPase D chain n=1 Tax=Paenibacillus baekrokdamisoli TaxID=1712516 RepID=A0A3G9JDA7_9BACL|nr:universal stress protein [Paenibacillus baekrokdamisoli]MBB3071528.1 two-component system sensor histidine kinase KdpD [Paenibacillus baekrokdamisoli]BBH21958.1 potassium-transporting P-type ATPase D chain [Paenibacillus baekrokdamisoli]
MQFKRKTPEELLLSISRLHRGRFKIWIGAMTGTGKTYRMLREGQSFREQGIDVVICAVSTLQRPETVKQLADLERVPSIHWEKDGIQQKDLNLEALLERNPELILVDGLAHRNRPEAKFPTRLDDIKFLLNHGISVMTTVNVYELADVRDRAYKLTGIIASETVPADTLELADEVQLVDVSPETMLQRMEEGIIGSRSGSDQALFKRGNLGVLRELTLRLVAEDVNDTLEKHRERLGLIGPSGATERILILTQYHWNGSIHLRRGQQIARRLNGDLLSVTFMKKGAELTKEQSSFRRAILKLADKIGAEHHELPIRMKRSLPDELVEFAHHKGVTRIVLGHSKQSKWQEWFHGSIAMGLLSRKTQMDLFFIADRAEHEGERIMPAKRISFKEEEQFRRLSADEVEKRIEAIKRGRLRVYIGAAPGVGKTYTMLREGNELLRKGVDAVIGLLETHGRQETAEQVGELTIIPRLKTEYRGTSLQEMDTDAIIARNPEVVLVDELAHTNIPGSVNKKRYEDVQRILQAGISVMTTVNVQHLESLNDRVEQLTGVRVRETVPDWLLQLADEVELIDVTPQMLQQRLQQGRIYSKEKVEQALGAFFKLGNLIALRELALREIADDVDERLEAWDRKSALRGQLQRKEMILVCVSDSEKALRLVRHGFRIAHRLKAAWHVVHVANHQGRDNQSDSKMDNIRKMTERFGGQFDLIQRDADSSIADKLLALAESLQATQLIIGQSGCPAQGARRLLWYFSDNIVKKLLREGRHMDMLVVRED